MATIRATGGSLLGTITNTANMVSGLVDTASDSISMLHSYVELAKTDQRDRHALHRKTFREELLLEAKTNMVTAEAEAVKFIGESELNKQLWDKASTLLDGVFADLDSKKS